MRLIFLLFLCFNYIFSQNLDFNSIYSNFTQTIVSPEGSSLNYKGDFYAKKPNFVVWKYEKPIPKSVYITDKNIILVEPNLEQVIISKIANIPNMIMILKEAKKISKNEYQMSYDGTKYNIYLKNDIPVAIKYIDKLENNVTINFTNTQTNLVLDDSLFIYNIPENYDILKQ